MKSTNGNFFSITTLYRRQEELKRKRVISIIYSYNLHTNVYDKIRARF